MTKKEFCPKGKIFKNTLKRKQNELLKVNVQLRKDYLRLRRRWTEKVGNREILILLYVKSINNLSHKDWSCIRQISGLIKLKEETVGYLEN